MKAYDRLPFKLVHKNGNMRLVDKDGKVVLFSNYKMFQNMSQDEYDDLWDIINSMVLAGNSKNLAMKRELEAIDPAAITNIIKSHVTISAQKSHFVFEGIEYEVDDSGLDYIMLPDDRVLGVGYWGESLPQRPCDLKLAKPDGAFDYSRAKKVSELV